MGDSAIEWTDKTWNPVRGCSVISPGCVNCYAMKQAHRFSGEIRRDGKGANQTVPGPYAGLTKQTSAGPQWTGVIRTVDDALLEPLSWRKPQRVFVNSMSDLFHEGVSDEFIDRVFAVMGNASQHTFQVLTKRADRMLAYMTRDPYVKELELSTKVVKWPLPNVWLGVSVESQKYADERIPLLLQTPAAVRFISAEPLLGPVDVSPFVGNGWVCACGWRDEDETGPAFTLEAHSLAYCPKCERSDRWAQSLDWVIVGGESGPGARPFDVAWARSIVRQCQAAGVPVFVKQLGQHVRDRNDAGFMGEWPEAWPDCIDQEDRVEHDLDGFRDGYQGAPVRVHLRSKKGGDPAEWPEDLRVREFPAVQA